MRWSVCSAPTAREDDVDPPPPRPARRLRRRGPPLRWPAVPRDPAPHGLRPAGSRPLRRPDGAENLAFARAGFGGAAAAQQAPAVVPLRRPRWAGSRSASSAASPSPRPWPTSRTSSCSTSRPRASTRWPGPASGRPSQDGGPGPARWSRPTTWTRRRSATASSSWPEAAWWQRETSPRSSAAAASSSSRQRSGRGPSRCWIVPGCRPPWWAARSVSPTSPWPGWPRCWAASTRA